MEVVKRVYIGETSRTLFHRVKQHRRDHNKAVRSSSGNNSSPPDVDGVESWIAEHALLSHGGLNGLDPEADVKFTVIQGHKDSFSRQIEESVSIH